MALNISYSLTMQLLADSPFFLLIITGEETNLPLARVPIIQLSNVARSITSLPSPWEAHASLSLTLTLTANERDVQCCVPLLLIEIEGSTLRKYPIGRGRRR